jgi:thiamine biosynthesis lipoprotein
MTARVHSIQFRAMGCQMGAWVVANDPAAAGQHLWEAREFFLKVEACCSRFLPDSELSRVNARAGQRVRVSELFCEVLGKALECATRTGGLFDPTVLSALEDAGYDRTFEAIQEDAGPPPPNRALPASWRDICVERGMVMVPEGTRLDLGGVAKAWAADCAAIRLAGLGPCLVDAGGDLMALGAPPGQPGWPIGVADPRRPDADLAVLWVRDCGVATSGVDFRRWRRGGVVQHHIIDPRTSKPARTDVLAVTVIAEDALEANVHALTALILGFREGLCYLRDQGGVEALLVREDGQVQATPGFPQYIAYPALGGFSG